MVFLIENSPEARHILHTNISYTDEEGNKFIIVRSPTPYFDEEYIHVNITPEMLDILALCQTHEVQYEMLKSLVFCKS